MTTETEFTRAIRIGALRRSYQRLYPGNDWGEATMLGLEEATKAMTAQDVLDAVQAISAPVEFGDKDKDLLLRGNEG